MFFIQFMKILQLTNRVPYPLNDGGNLAVHFYMEGFLKAGVSLSLLSMNTTRHPVNLSMLSGLFEQLEQFKTIPVDNRIRPVPAFLNLFSEESYHVSRFVSKDFENALIQLLRQESFDIIQLEGLYLAPYIATIRHYSKAKIVLRQHNVEFVIWERLARQETVFWKKKYLKLLAKRLRNFEQSTLNQADLLLPISEQDAETFRSMGASKPMLVQSFGVDLSKIPYSPAAQPPISLYHLGALDWQPNQEAIHFFLEQVMPKISQALPNVKFHLAGRNMPDVFRQLKQDNVVIYGEVPDATAFEKGKSILVVPLRAGGGIRIKILRAMAMGKAVVATPTGMEGIHIQDGKEAWIATTADEMAEKVIFLAKHPDVIYQTGKEARKFMEQHHNQKQMIAQLMEKYQELITTT